MLKHVYITAAEVCYSQAKYGGSMKSKVVQDNDEKIKCL